MASEDTKEYGYLDQIQSGTTFGGFADPRGIAIDKEGNLYVADTLNHRIVKFQMTDTCPAGTEKVATEAGKLGLCLDRNWEEASKDGKPVGPTGVDIYETDNGVRVIYATAASPKYIIRISENGAVDKEWHARNATGNIGQIYDVALDAEGDIMAADRNGRIWKFDQSGTEQPFPLDYGNEKIPLNNPSGIAIDPFGYIYVTDSGNHRVLKFDNTGRLAPESWNLTVGGGFFNTGSNSPIGIFANNKTVFVADTGGHRIFQFHLDGTLVPEGEIGTGKCDVKLGKCIGQFNAPRGLFSSYGGYLFVADSDNNRIQVFAGTSKPIDNSLKEFESLGISDFVNVTNEAQDNGRIPITPSMPQITGSERLEPDEYKKAMDDCGIVLGHNVTGVWDTVSGKLEGVTFHVIRPDILLVEGNVYRIPVVFNSDSGENIDLDVWIRSFPFELISSANNPRTHYNTTAGVSPPICHEFKATWDGRWSITVDIQKKAVTLDENATKASVTLDIQIQDQLVWLQIQQTKSATMQTEALVNQTQIAAENLRQAVGIGLLGVFFALLLVAVEAIGKGTKSNRRQE